MKQSFWRGRESGTTEVKKEDVSGDWLTAQSLSTFEKRKQNDYNNYRRICLVDSVYKICATILKQCMQSILDHLTLEEQNDLMNGRSCTDVAFIFLL